MCGIIGARCGITLSERSGTIRALFATLSVLPAPVRRVATRKLVDATLFRYARVQVSGPNHIPASGPVLFISNHLSNVDAFCLQKAFGRKVIFLAGVKLQTTTLTRMMLEIVPTIPIKPGAPDKDAIKTTVSALKAGERVLIFPEGGRSRSGALREGKPGALLIAKMARVPIVPIGLQGTEKVLPIKEHDMEAETNTLYAADVTVRVGQPFTLDELAPAPEGHPDPKQWQTDQMMLKIAALLDPQYQGVYNTDPVTGGI